MTHHLTFHYDPGHGWMQAPIDLVRRLGIGPRISTYSYRDARHVYLEEDCDLGLLLRALDACGEEYVITDVHHNHDAPMRRMQRWEEGFEARRRTTFRFNGRVIGGS